MEKLALTIEVLRRLVETEDSVATLVAERRVEEFLAREPRLDQKIENLKLLRRGFLPVFLRMEDYPKKQYAESIVEYMDHRLRMLEEALANAS